MSLRRIEQREAERNATPVAPSTLTGSASVKPAKPINGMIPSPPSNGSRCSRCSSCTTNCPCVASMKQLKVLEMDVAKEQLKNKAAQDAVRKAAQEIEILRRLVEERSATQSTASSRRSVASSAKSSTRSVVSSATATSSRRSEASSCPTSQIYRLLDEYNREARLTGGQELSLPALSRKVPSTSPSQISCESPFSATSASSARRPSESRV